MSELVLPTSSTGRLVQTGTAGERYRLGRELGRGGMGVVYEARDEILGREVAIKVLLASPTKRPDLVRRFIRESQIAGQLQHPGIPAVHDLGWLLDGRPFLALKLISGQTLGSLLATHPEDRERHLGIFEQLCQTMAFVHARRYIHRDLKPTNVMVGPFGEVQVVDWGIARSLEGPSEEEPRPEAGFFGVGGPSVLTDTGEVLGTPTYMAPERMRGEPGDLRSDVYSLGGILSEILTGRAPVWSERMILARLIPGGDGLEPLRGCDADPALIELAIRCLDPDPAGRPAHAGEVAAAILAYREQVAERARQSEREQAATQARQSERAQRQWLAMASLAVVLLSVGGMIGLMWHSASRAAAHRQVVEEITQEALQRSEEALQRRDWPRVIAILEPAIGQMAGVSAVSSRMEQLHSRLAAARFAEELERFRREERLPYHEDINIRRSVAPIARIFSRHGWEMGEGEPALLAQKVEAHPAREEILNGLYLWYYAEKAGPDKERLLRVLRAVDTDPWRQEYLRQQQTVSLGTLLELARTLPEYPQPPEVVVGLARQLDRFPGEHGLSFRRMVQRRFPQEFWYNLELSAYLLVRGKDHREGLGYAQVAVALRPQEASGWNNLGLLQLNLGLRKEAKESLARATQIAPELRSVRLNYALALHQAGFLEECRAQAERVRASGLPPLPETHYVAGLLAAAEGKEEEARAELRRAWEGAARHPVLRDRILLMADRLIEEERVDEELAVEPTAGLHYTKAKYLIERGEYREAVRQYRAAAVFAPENTHILMDRARLHYQMGDGEAGMDAVAQAVLMNPEVISQVLLFPAFQENARPVEGLDALTIRLINRYPQHAKPLVLRVLYHLQLGQTQDAWQVCQAALEVDRRLGDALVAKGDVLKRMGRPEGAQTSYFLAHAYARDAARPLLALGELWMQEQRPAAATTVYRYMQRVQGRSLPAELGLVDSLLAQDKMEEASQAIASAMRQYPQDSRLWTRRGLVSWRRRKFAEAERSLSHAVWLNPNNSQARLNLGQVLLSQNRVSAGLKLLENACARAPEDAQVHAILGSALAGQKRFREADGVLRRAVELNPSRIEAVVEWVAVLGELNRFVEAERVLESATRKHPRDARLLCLHGQMLLRLHRYSQAAIRLEQSRQALPAGSRNLEYINEQIRHVHQLIRLEQRLEGVLAGKVEPTPAETLDLIDVYARAKGKPVEALAWAMRFLDEQPKIVENPQRNVFLRLGVLALLAAEAQPAEAMRWRRQSLTWLDRERRVWERMAAESALLPGEYERWQQRIRSQPALEAYQSEDRLRQLPREEAEAWRKLWRWTDPAGKP